MGFYGRHPWEGEGDGDDEELEHLRDRFPHTYFARVQERARARTECCGCPQCRARYPYFRRVCGRMVCEACNKVF